MDKHSTIWRAFLPEILLFVAMAVLLCLNATAFDIDTYSELFHIEAAKETASANRFWIPLLNGHDYLIRSPFWTWIVLIFFKVFGISLWAARLPAILCALGGMALTYMVALELSQSRFSAFFAAAILGGTWGYFHMGSLSTADILEVNLVMGFTWAFLQWYARASRRNTMPMEINIFSAILGVLLGLMLLVKGMPGVLLLFAISMLHLFFHQSLDALGKLNLSILLPVALFIPLPWLMIASIGGGNAMFIFDYLLTQPFERLIGSGPWQGLHLDPLFYLKRLPGDLMPYLLFIPALLMDLVLPRRAAGLMPNQDQPWLFWLLGWFILGLVVLSLSAFQEPTLMLPFYAPLAITIGYYLGRMAETVYGTDPYNNTLAAFILTLMIVAVMSSIMIFQVLPSDYVSGFWHLPGQPVLEVLKVAGHEFKLDEAFPLWKFWLIPGPFILLIGGWTVYLLQVSRRIPAATLALIGTFLVFFLFVKAIYLPIMHRPVARSFAQQINHHAKAGDEIILYSMHPDIKRVLFYLDADKLAQTRFTRNPELIRERLKNSQGSLYGVIREGGYFNDLEASDRSQLRINQFNWKWDMSRLDEFRKFLVVRQPLFEKMKSDMLYFQSLPVPLMSELQSDITSTPKGEDRRSRRRNRY